MYIVDMLNINIEHVSTYIISILQDFNYSCFKLFNISDKKC